MEYGGLGGGLGPAAGGLGGGAAIALLPNTGGSLRVFTIAAVATMVAGLAVLVSALVRLAAIRKLSA